MRRTVLLVFMLVLCAFLWSCAALTPGQQAALDDLQAKITEVYTEAATAAAQVERIYKRQAEVRQQLKDGEITAEFASNILVELGAELAEAMAHFNELKEHHAGLMDKLNEMKEQGVPWYQTAWAIVSTIVAAYYGTKTISLGKKTLDLTGALDFIVGRVAKKNTTMEVKESCKSEKNPYIEAAVKKLPIVLAAPPSKPPG